MLNEISTAPVTGYRTWRVVEPGYLLDIGSRQLWMPNERYEARCTVGLHPGLAAPVESCTCGIYSAKDVAHLELLNYREDAFGEVALWGKVVEGTQGWRSQFAYPKEIHIRSDRRDATELSIKLSMMYGVPAVVVDPPPRPEPDEYDRYRNAGRKRKATPQEMKKRWQAKLDRLLSDRLLIAAQIREAKEEINKYERRCITANTEL